jgi:hypothetical protein
VIRAALLLVLALAALPAAAGAAVPPALGPDGRVYPLVGGGSRAPAEGLAATRAALGFVAAFATMADGSVAVLMLTEDAFAVGPDGRIRMLPSPPGEADDGEAFEGAPDGSLLLLLDGRVLRLAPGAAQWAEQPRPPGIPASFVPGGLAPLPSGYALLGSRRTWWVQGGAAAVVEHAPASLTAAVRSDGTVVRATRRGDGLLALAPDAPVRTLREPSGDVAWGGLIGLPDDGFLGLRVPGQVDLLTADGATETVLTPRADLGTGVGGPFLATAETPLAIAPDGAMPTLGRGATIRIAVPPGSARTLAAVAPPTYRGLRRGEVTISSTFAGAAGIEVRSGGEVVTAALAPVQPGETAVPLVDPPPPGIYVVALRLTAPDGREARHRMRVVTLPRLPRTLARRAIRRYERRARLGGAAWIELQRCGRTGAKTFACRAVQVERRRRAPDRRQCVGVWTARLRPDGIHSRVREAPRACREPGPAR